MSSYWIYCDRCWWQQNAEPRSSTARSRVLNVALLEICFCFLFFKKTLASWLTCRRGSMEPTCRWTTVQKRSANNRQSHKAAETMAHKHSVLRHRVRIDASESLCKTDQSLHQIAIDTESHRLIDQVHLACVRVCSNQIANWDNLAESNLSPRWRSRQKGDHLSHCGQVERVCVWTYKYICNRNSAVVLVSLSFYYFLLFFFSSF